MVGVTHYDVQPWDDDTASEGEGASGVFADDGELHGGQVRMAYRLEQAYAGKLMHVHSIGWFSFTGQRWEEDRYGIAKRAVIRTLECALSDSMGDKDLRRDVARCESAAGIAGVLDVAAALEGFAATVDDLDVDPYLFNTATGTVDLRTGEVSPHRPSDRITKLARAAYTPQTISDRWQAFMDDILPDEQVRGFLQRLIGSSLQGTVREHILPILTGTGANGKSVLMSVLAYAIGDYATTAEPDLFMHREGAHPTGLMDLMGRRLVTVSESERDRRLAEATMKRLVGGDKIKARRMRQDFTEFDPSHTLLLVTNHLPKVRGDDPAIWRRIVVIPFDVVIPESKRDPGLSERLQLDADGVLSWVLQGWHEYQRMGLAIPDAVKVATDAYQRDSDAIARFIDECCLIFPQMFATTSELHTRYTTWAQQDGAESVSLKAFGQAIDKAGYPASKAGGRRVRRGIGIADDSKEPEQW